MTDAERLELGRAGYDGYAGFTAGKTFDGRAMPPWEALPPNIQGAWGHAAQAIVDAHAERAEAERLPDTLDEPGKG